MALHTADRRTSTAIVAGAALICALAGVLAACTQHRPAPLPAPPAQAAAAAPAAPAAPRLDPAYGLFFNQDGDDASLAYGRANSDDVQLMLQCRRGSRRVEITDVAGETAPKGAAPLVLISGAARSELKAKVAPDETGATLATAQAPADLPALSGFRSSGVLTVQLAGREYAVQASDGERPTVARFFSACERR